MIRHHTLVVPRPEGLDPDVLERLIAEHTGGRPVRWAIVRADATTLHLEAAAWHA